MQTDSRWKDIMYSITGDKKQTIGSSGCGPTCAAMVIQTLRNNGVTPVQKCAWALKNGYRTKNQGTSFAYFVPQLAIYNIKAEQTSDYSTALAALIAGKMVIGRARAGLWTSSGHYILAYGVDGVDVLVLDPNSQAAARSKAPLSIFRAQVSPFWIVKEEWQMTPDDVRKIVREELRGKSDQPAAWAKESWDKARKLGITDGTNPGGYTTREQVVAMIVRSMEQ
jgi:hypothetical protein